MSGELKNQIDLLSGLRNNETTLEVLAELSSLMPGDSWITNFEYKTFDIKDKKKGVGLAKRIESGSGNVNDLTVTYGVTEAPFGERKDSGIGRVNGDIGLKGYCHIKPILIDRFGGKQTAGMYPCSQKKDVGMLKFMRFLWGTPVGRWMSLRKLMPS